MSDQRRAGCGRCGKDPADGFAEINGVRLCHGDEVPSCYELEGLQRWQNQQMNAAHRVVVAALGHCWRPDCGVCDAA